MTQSLECTGTGGLTSSFKVRNSQVQMSVKDYIKLNTGKKEEFGIEGYRMVKPDALYKPIVAKLPVKDADSAKQGSAKHTFIDDAVRSKRNVPDFKYNIAGDMVKAGHKSDLERDIRRTQPV